MAIKRKQLRPEEIAVRERCPGVRKLKSGKWVAEIKDPSSSNNKRRKLRHRRLWLGTFGTAEGACTAYMAKKREFESRIDLSCQNSGEFSDSPCFGTETEVNCDPTDYNLEPSSVNVIKKLNSPCLGTKTELNSPCRETETESNCNTIESWASVDGIKNSNLPCFPAETEVNLNSSELLEEKAPVNNSENNPILSEMSGKGSSDKAASEVKIEKNFAFSEDPGFETASNGRLLMVLKEEFYYQAFCGEDGVLRVDFGSPVMDNLGFLLGQFSSLDDDLWIC